MNLPILRPDPTCTACPLHTQAKSVGVPTRHYEGSLPWSPTTPLMVFLGRNPGFHEDQSGECFVGRSGEMLVEGYIKPLNFHTRASIYLTNTVRCYTTDNAPPNYKNHIAPCFHHTKHDLFSLWENHTAPKFLIPLGDQALEAVYRLFLNRKKVPLKDAFASSGTEHTIDDPRFTFRLVPSYHPTAVLRNINYAYVVDQHMQLLDVLLRDGKIPTSEPTIVPSSPPRTR